jgi:hypothetical protein
MKKGKILLAAVLAVSLTAGIGYAHTVPGWDEPYDPANYYSPTSISYPDSAPSPFAMRELSRGDVYDYTRHIKSILFGNDFGNIYQNLFAQLLNEVLDMTGTEQGKLAQVVWKIGDIFGTSQGVGATADIPYMVSQSIFRQSETDEGDCDDHAQLKWAGSIYLNGLNAYKASDEDMEKRSATLNEALENAANAQGNIQATQAQAQVGAVYNAEMSRRDALLSNYAAMEAAHSRMQLDQDRQDIKAVRDGLSFKVIDRDNLSKTDYAIYVPHTAPGYYKF